MDIILIADGGEQTRKFRLTKRWFWGLISALPLVLLLGGAYLGYWLASSESRGLQVAQATAIWEQQLQSERHKIEVLRDRVSASMHALAREVGMLQARMTRLDAVGQRMVKTAGLDPDLFGFDGPPPVGGPESDLTGPVPTEARLQQKLDALAARLDEREQQLRVLRDLMIADELRQQAVPSGKPVEQGWISSVFGWRIDPFTGRRSLHEGIDFATRAGAVVQAVAPGVVTAAGWHSGYGLMVEIDHGNGYVTRYGHNRKLLVEVGERVDRGEAIAKVGSTGRSTGPHVHFEVIKNGRVVNPAQYLRAAR